MTSRKTAGKSLSEEEIDRVVEAQGSNDSAWGQPVRVVRATPASLHIPAELAARAAFLARLHKEENLEGWLTRIIKERVELEEVAFTEAKRELSLRGGT
jgi:hypothetical protein